MSTPSSRTIVQTVERDSRPPWGQRSRYLRTCIPFLSPSPINGITSRPLQRICFNNPWCFALSARPAPRRKELPFPELPFATRPPINGVFRLEKDADEPSSGRNLLDLKRIVTSLPIINVYFRARGNWLGFVMSKWNSDMGDPISENVDLTMTYFEVKRPLAIEELVVWRMHEFRACILINVKLHSKSCSICVSSARKPPEIRVTAGFYFISSTRGLPRFPSRFSEV